LYDSEIWALENRSGSIWVSFEHWCCRGMKKIKWLENATNKDFIKQIEKRTLVKNIMRIKSKGY